MLYTSKGIITLKASKTHRNKFEQGMIDEFTIEAVDLGPLKKLRIGHDNCGTLRQTALQIMQKVIQSLSLFVSQ